jgi:predicted transposase/invertase (TIGR01784 family)
MSRKDIKELTIKDNFIFGAVMKNPQKCKAVLECVLGIKIRKIEYPELEKTIDKTIESKSIRLDVYVEDEFNTIYNIEMQTTDNGNLPKRTRYYQGMIDLNIIDKGEDYKKLRRSYVIFICDYDEFKLGRHIYTFEKSCNEVPGLKLGDDTVVIVLNTKGTEDDVSEEMKDLLDYIGGKEPKSELAKSLDSEVQNVKSNGEWRREYMTLLMRDRENIALGKVVNLVSLIRNLKVDIETATEVLGVDAEYITHVQDVIKEHPELDDEEIAEIILDF